MKPQLKDVISGFSHLETIEETKSNVSTYAHLEDPKINEEYQNKVSKHRVLYNEFIPNEKPCIEIVEENETFSFARFGNITTITGQKLVLNRIKVTAPGNKRRVLYFDTEQSRGDVKEVLNRIIEIAAFKNLNEKHLELILCFSIKAMSPKERHEFISSTIHKEENIGLVIIDGIKDLMTSVNNEEQTSVIITDLLKWSEEQNIHICSILHENPLSEKMRGHIGTELINKCESVVSIQKNTENATRSEVVAKKTRKKQFSNFAFRISEAGIPIFDDNYEPEKIGRKPKIKIDKLNSYDIHTILNICFENQKELSYSDLLERLNYAFLTHKQTSIGVNVQKDVLSYLKGKNKITKVDPDNHKSKFIRL